MTPEEQNRLNQLSRYEEKGQAYFNLIEEFYAKEELLNKEDVYDRKGTSIRINYLRRQYLLEATYNFDNGFGQIKVYEAREGTIFWTEPEFITKPNSMIFYDNPGNIYIGGGAAHMNPEQCAEELIKEISK